MVYKCSVPLCKSGYSSQRRKTKKIHFFQFPTDPERRRAWIRAIRRTGFIPTKYSKVCSQHFTADDYVSETNPANRQTVKRVNRPSLKCDAIPTVFHNFPTYLRSEPVTRRSERATSTSRLENENLELTLNIESFEEEDVVGSLESLKTKFSGDSPSSNFVLSPTSSVESLIFLQFATGSPPKIVKSVVVFCDLSFVAYEGTECIPSRVYEHSMSFPKNITRYTDFLNLLSNVNNYDSEKAPLYEAIDILSSYVDNHEMSHFSVQKILFICEQLQLLCHPPGLHQKFSTNLLTIATLWKAHSTSCYKAILSENVLTLPSLRTLRRIAQNFSSLESDTSRYLSLRIENLNRYERTVILLFDEIYVHQCIEYNNGRFVGLSTNDDKPATTLLCFMIKSLASKYSDVVATIPIHGLNVNCLREHCFNVLKVVMNAGFHVVALCSDNHPVNRSFYKYLSDDVNIPCDNPFDPTQKLYLLIDPTHTIKNLYNNFQRRVHFEFPKGFSFTTANFNHVKSLYELESSMSLRMAHKLNKAVLAPTNIQRASAKLAFALFSDSTISAFQYHTTHEHPEWSDTFKFLSFITDLTKLCNIRSKYVGQKSRDVLKLPFDSESDERLKMFLDYADFFKKWRASKRQGLTTETFLAIENVCRVLPNLIALLLSTYDFEFVLTGFLQSDPLEARFGRYRQMSGGNFFISVKQVIESERKIRLSSILKHSDISLDRINECADRHEGNVRFAEPFDIDDLPDVQMIESELQIVYFISGYCAKRVVDDVKCTECINFFISRFTDLPTVEHPCDFFSNLNRGGLKAPADEIFILCCTAYEVFCKIKRSSKFEDFLRLDSPRDVFVVTVLNHMKTNNICHNICSANHDLESYFQKSISVFFNCLARNFLRAVSSTNILSDSRKICKLRSTRQKE